MGPAETSETMRLSEAIAGTAAKRFLEIPSSGESTHSALCNSKDKCAGSVEYTGLTVRSFRDA